MILHGYIIAQLILCENQFSEIIGLLCSLPALPVSPNQILIGSKLLKPHRPSCVKLLRADADFRAKAELESVCKSGRGIDINAGGVHFA